MKTRILKKVNQRVRIVENNGMYEVQKRTSLGFGVKFSEWKAINSFSKYKKAVEKKNLYIVMEVMRELGYRHYFVEKRIDRKKRLGLI